MAKETQKEVHQEPKQGAIPKKSTRQQQGSETNPMGFSEFVIKEIQMQRRITREEAIVHLEQTYNPQPQVSLAKKTEAAILAPTNFSASIIKEIQLQKGMTEEEATAYLEQLK